MSTEAKPHARLTLEYVDPSAIGIDVDDGSLPELVVWAIQVLSLLVPHPAQCRLVVTGDFVESVKARASAEYAAAFNLERGIGMVGAKTMPLEDGTIDVLVHAITFWTEADPEDASDREASFRRLLVHEAQHVSLRQRGEQSVPYADGGTVANNLRTAADAAIEEYRAELTVHQTEFAQDDDWQIAGVLEHWRETLARAASVDYQQHLDPAKLFFSIMEASHIVWKVLAYVVASEGDGATSAQLDVANPLWHTMVAPHWPRFVEILSQVPPAHEDWASDEHTRVVDELADESRAWLLTLGFEAIDREAGWEFWIRNWSLLEVDS